MNEDQQNMPPAEGEGMGDMNQGMQPPVEEKSSESKGPTIGIIIIILILVVGAIYIFTTREETPTLPSDDVDVEAILDQDESTEMEAIEQDIDFDLGDLDAELEDMEGELMP